MHTLFVFMDEYVVKRTTQRQDEGHNMVDVERGGVVRPCRERVPVIRRRNGPDSIGEVFIPRRKDWRNGASTPTSMPKILKILSKPADTRYKYFPLYSFCLNDCHGRYPVKGDLAESRVSQYFLPYLADVLVVFPPT